MNRRGSVRSTYKEFVTAAGLSKKSKSWYRRTDETIVVLTLARAPYGHQYSLAVGVVLRALDADQAPKHTDCPIRSRFDLLVPSTLEHRVNDLLDLEFPLDDGDRRIELLALLRSELLPVLEAVSTIESLRSGAGHDLVRHFTVNDEARAFLADPGSS